MPARQAGETRLENARGHQWLTSKPDSGGVRPSGRESIARLRRRLERRASQARFFRVMGPFLEAPKYVRNEQFAETGAKVRVEDDTTLKLFNLTVNVELSSEQVN